MLPENWDAVRLFEAAGTQWRRAGMTGIPTGLDLAGAEATARALEIPWTADLLDRLATMERAALEAMNARS